MEIEVVSARARTILSALVPRQKCSTSPQPMSPAHPLSQFRDVGDVMLSVPGI